jgi:flavin reductase
MTKVASQDYRDAMARLGAAVNIVTTDGRAGRAGFTASAVCSVTDNPPTLLVCMNRGSSAYACVRENGVVCVNVLSARRERLFRLNLNHSRRFIASLALRSEWERNGFSKTLLAGSDAIE